MNYNELSKEKQLEAVKENGLTIQYINNPCIEVQLAAVKKNGFAIEYIDNPSKEVQLEAVKKDGFAIKYIDNPSEEIKMTAVETDGYAIGYIDNPSEEMQLEAISQYGCVIDCIVNPSEEMKLEAVKRTIQSLNHIKDLESSNYNWCKYYHIKDHKEYRMYKCINRVLFVDLSNKDDIRYTIGCQYSITKNEFIDRIYNDCPVKGKGLKCRPYRQEYLDIIESIDKELQE